MKYFSNLLKNDKMNKKLFLLSLLVLVFSFQNLFAQWQKTNEPKDSAVCLYINKLNGNIYAGTYRGGVYLSSDNGGSWKAVNNKLSDTATICSLAINGTNGYIYAGTFNQGVLLSTDNGISWTAKKSGLATIPILGRILPVLSLAISDDGANVFAGTLGIDTTVSFLHVVLGGVYLSANNGSTWTAKNNGALAAGTSVFALHINGVNMIAGNNGFGYSTKTGNGVYLSNNNASNWTAVSNGLTDKDIFSFAINGANMYTGTKKGVFLSTDTCKNWSIIGLSGYSVLTLAVCNDSIFAGTIGGGVFLSTNNGANWNAINEGLGNLDILSLAVKGGYVIAGTAGDGIWRCKLSEITGITESATGKQHTAILAYPNPVNDQLTISSQANAKEQVNINIYDATGRIVYSSGMNQKQISTSNLPNGVYILKISSINSVQLKKLVVNH